MSEAESFYNMLQTSTEKYAYIRRLRLLCTQSEPGLLEIRRLLLQDGNAWRPWIWRESGKPIHGHVHNSPMVSMATSRYSAGDA
jgi:hypothetical protein